MSVLENGNKVFGIGLSRTGTTSLTDALNLLGVRTMHYPHDDQTFAELARGNYRLSVLSEYQGVTDTPVAPFYAQLDRAWPGSKFILTVRAKTQWLQSAEAHWSLLKQHGKMADDQRFQAFADFISACVYGTIYFSAERFSYVYDVHVQNVRAYFADRPEDLLVLDITSGEGWGKLCAFLGLPVPDQDFPYVNRDIWMRTVVNAERDLASVIASDEPIVLIDQETLRKYLAVNRRVLPFVERAGQFSGLPEDDTSAIREVERMRKERGAAFLAVAADSFWVLKHYSGLAAHLRSQYPCVLENERLIVFRLSA